jgi:hypothetical protein
VVEPVVAARDAREHLFDIAIHRLGIIISESVRQSPRFSSHSGMAMCLPWKVVAARGLFRYGVGPLPEFGRRRKHQGDDCSG